MRLKRSTLVPESDITDKAFVQIRRMWLPEQNPDFIQVRTNIGFTWKIISHLALGCLSNKVEELEQTFLFKTLYSLYIALCSTIWISIAVNFNCSVIILYKKNWALINILTVKILFPFIENNIKKNPFLCNSVISRSISIQKKKNPIPHIFLRFEIQMPTFCNLKDAFAKGAVLVLVSRAPNPPSPFNLDSPSLTTCIPYRMLKNYRSILGNSCYVLGLMWNIGAIMMLLYSS